MPKANRIVVNRVYVRAQAAMGEDWPETNGGMNRRIIAALLDRGYPEDDIVLCAAYVGKETYVGCTDMRRVRQVIASWLRAGRPEQPGKPGEVARLGRAEEYGRLGQKVDKLTGWLRRGREEDGQDAR